MNFACGGAVIKDVDVIAFSGGAIGHRLSVIYSFVDKMAKNTVMY